MLIISKLYHTDAFIITMLRRVITLSDAFCPNQQNLSSCPKKCHSAFGCQGSRHIRPNQESKTSGSFSMKQNGSTFVLTVKTKQLHHILFSLCFFLFFIFKPSLSRLGFISEETQRCRDLYLIKSRFRLIS